MKFVKASLKVIALCVVVCLSESTFSQSVVDSNGDTIMIIDKNGIIKTGLGSSKGEIHSNNASSNNRSIKNLVGDIVGRIVGDEFIDMNGDVLGRIDVNNKVFDINNDQIGEIVSGTQILDVNGDVIGIATSPVNSKWLAALFFFFNDSI